MTARAFVTDHDIAEVVRLAGEGYTTPEIAKAVERTGETVRRIARNAGVQIAVRRSTARPPAPSSGRPIPTREELRAIHLSGPAMGRCARCGTWRPLYDGRVKPHPHGERECTGSRMRPQLNHTDE